MTDQPRDLAAEAAEISRIHDEGRYDQYGEHPAESIGTLLDYIAALSRELEEATQAGIDTAREISDTLTGRIDELEAENERLQSQLTALRRPVEQSAELAEILERMDVGNGLWSDLPKLRAALDITTRQLRERVEMLEAAQGEIAQLKESNECLELGAGLLECADIVTEREIDRLNQEIGRLSSPPQERAEIAKLSTYTISKEAGQWYATDSDGEKSSLEQGDEYCDVIAIDRIKTLLGDCAAWRNALAVSNATIKDLRQRIERLEAALRFAIDAPGSHWLEGTSRKITLDRLRAALAASQHTAGSGDGVAQQPIPGIDQGQFLASCEAGNRVFGEGGAFGGTPE